jgi:hypothetical protein
MIIGRNLESFCSVSNLVLSHVINWFAANNLVVNLDKINIMKFITQNSSHSTLHVGYKEEYKQVTMNTIFFIFIVTPVHVVFIYSVITPTTAHI